MRPALETCKRLVGNPKSHHTAELTYILYELAHVEGLLGIMVLCILGVTVLGVMLFSEH